MTSAVEWVVELSVADGQADAAATLLNDMATVIGAGEPNTEIWAWFRSNDGHSVSIIERYSNADAVLTHLENFAEFADRFLAILSPTRFTVFADPTPAVRDAISGFGPVYVTPGGGFRR